MGEAILREEHEEFKKRMEEEHKRQNRRIQLLEDNVQVMQSLTISVEKMALNMECMLKEQKKQGERLEALEGVPKKNFNTFKYALIGALGTAFGGAIAAVIINLF